MIREGTAGTATGLGLSQLFDRKIDVSHVMCS